MNSKQFFFTLLLFTSYIANAMEPNTHKDTSKYTQITNHPKFTDLIVRVRKIKELRSQNLDLVNHAINLSQQRINFNNTQVTNSKKEKEDAACYDDTTVIGELKITDDEINNLESESITIFSDISGEVLAFEDIIVILQELKKLTSF